MQSKSWSISSKACWIDRDQFFLFLSEWSAVKQSSDSFHFFRYLQSVFECLASHSLIILDTACLLSPRCQLRKRNTRPSNRHSSILQAMYHSRRGSELCLRWETWRVIVLLILSEEVCVHHPCNFRAITADWVGNAWSRYTPPFCTTQNTRHTRYYCYAHRLPRPFCSPWSWTRLLPGTDRRCIRPASPRVCPERRKPASYGQTRGGLATIQSYTQIGYESS